MFAGMVCGPLTIGPAGNLMVFAVIATYCFCTLPFKDNPEEGKLERRLNMFLNGKWQHHIEKLKGVAGVNALASKESIIGSGGKTRVVSAPTSIQPVKAIKQDGATTIAGARISEVLVKPGQLVKPGEPVVKIEDRAVEAATDKKITAKTIFDALDGDKSGQLEGREIVAVLISWGVQRLEAERVVQQIISQRLTQEDRERSFVYWEHPKTKELEFKVEWEPIWRYQTNNINEAIAKYKRFSEHDAARMKKNDTRRDLMDAAKGAAPEPEPEPEPDIEVEKKVQSAEDAEYERKAQMGMMAASGVLSAEDALGLSYEEAADLQLAFRPADPDALKVHDIRGLMYNNLGADCIPGFPHVSDFLKAKDGDPFIFSLPGWLGCCDLALYVLQMPFFFMGIFQVGGEEWAWVCYAGFLMLPHYLNDFFCCEFSNGCLCFPFWRGR